MAEDATDLSYSTTDELVDELKQRFDCVVVLAETKKDEERSEFLVKWRGSMTYAMGLIQRASCRFAHRVNREADTHEGENG